MLTYAELKEWTEQHGGTLGVSSVDGERDHAWGIRDAATSLCGLWPGPDKLKPNAGQYCAKCAGVAKAIGDRYTRLEGGSARWP